MSQHAVQMLLGVAPDRRGKRRDAQRAAGTWRSSPNPEPRRPSIASSPNTACAPTRPSTSGRC